MAISQAGDGAVAPTDDGGLSHVQKIEQGQHVAGHQFVADLRRVAAGAAVPPAIQQDHFPVAPQFGHQVAPVVGIRQPAVQQHDGWRR
ncbi:MAG: hypothetical protein WDN04_14345 [Rhodospirillales bacterium]